MMRKSIMTWLQKAGAGLLVGSAVLLSAGCAGVVYTEPAAGVYYNYDYYPDVGVYYYPADRVYYWNEGGHWHSGGHLPPKYVVHGRHEQVHAHSRQPWTEHQSEHGQPDHGHDHH
jgi:hypothetical protein